MAKATKEEKVTVTLELTEDEARAVYHVLCRVGGPLGSRRALIGGVVDALSGAGFRSLDGSDDDLIVSHCRPHGNKRAH